MEDAKSGKSEWTPDGSQQMKQLRNERCAAIFLRPAGDHTIVNGKLWIHQSAEEDQIVRLASSAAVGGVIDVHLHPEKRGVGGYGTVHHVAFRTKKKEQAKWLPIIAENHLPSSEILDREYFTSVYFREKGGILFEIATDEPAL